MSANQWDTNTPTVIDPAELAAFNAGTARAIRANRHQFICRCGVSTLTERGLRRHQASWCKRELS
jgi:hypothetical protein